MVIPNITRKTVRTSAAILLSFFMSVLLSERALTMLTAHAFQGGKDAQTAQLDKIETLPPGLSEVSVIALPNVKRQTTTSGPIGPRALSGGVQTTEAEPNGTSATATALSGDSVKVKGNIFPLGEVDFYSFSATAGDRIYAATQTLHDASASGDSVLDLLDTDGATVLETDNNDGTFNASSSSIAGFLIPANGTYFFRVRHNVGTGSIRPYDLHFQRQSGAPVAEVEPNETPATATPLPASGWVSGAITAVSPGEADFYSLTLGAGDTVYLSMDMNPERDANVWNGRLGFGLFGNPPANQILVANDANAGATATDPNSEAFFFTVKDAGTYFVYVDSIVAAGLGANATYHLSVSVYNPVPKPGSCTTYTSTNVPVAIPSGPGMVTSTLTVPGNPRIADLDVTINLNHTFMQDLDVHLVSPAGNDNGLFTDIGAATVGGPQTLLDITLDDDAGLPFAFAMSASFILQPELPYRLKWFNGENAGGTWTLVMRDDATGDGGTLNSWSITVCEPPPAPTCGAGFAQTTVFSTDFESGDAGFTHSGANDEWERGLPTFVPITTCNSGVNCWKTDLDNSYNASSSQDLVSPNINLAGLSGPVYLNWAMRYHIESANFDHFFVEAREVGNPSNAVRVFNWLDATMNNTVGNPATTIAESGGWGQHTADISALAGLNIELVFHLDSDTTVQLQGVAIDDVSVTACMVAATGDLSITKTDGVTTAVPGGSTTYTITASNAGPDAITNATVADTFPATLTCTWTCVGAGGGTCTAAGAGNINDTVNLPTGGSVTYTATCAIAPGATGTLSNTATVSGGSDPNPANNSATDTDTLTPMGDLAITKTDGVTTVTAGGSTTYTITAANAGPSNAPGATVTDTFPASLTCTWTCVGAGGGTCTAAGAGNINDTVNLPAGGSVTYTASCTVSPVATGTLVNTANVIAPGGVPDPVPGNNSATDTDTIQVQADLAITKTDSISSVVAGTNTTYTIVASNAGPGNVIGATVTDNFPAVLTGATWTCVGAGGGTCPAAGAGNIAATVNLPAGGSVTFTATVTVSGGAPGTVSNTATVSVPGGVTELAPGNNSATDTNTVTCPVVTIAPATLPNGVQGAAYNQSVVASPAGGNYTYAVTTNILPPGLSLNAATGAITGTPTAAGNYTFVITATGWGNCPKTQTYNLLITGTCATITVNPATLPNGILGTAYPATTVSATGGVAPYTFAVTQGALPAGLALNSTTGEITGTPTAPGSFSFRVTATGQGGCTGSRVYVVSVACATLTFNPAGPALPNGAKGVAYNQAITVTPGTGHTFSVLLGSLPPGFTLSAAGVLSGLTNQAGTWTFTVKAVLGSCQATKQYTLTIPNTMAPTALAQLNDYDGDGKGDLALFAANGEWRIQRSSDQKSQTVFWGTAGDLPVSGDYDGDGKTDIAVFRPSNGTWYILPSGRSSDGAALVKAWGLGTDVPVPGDYDGDGKTDLAVWRGGEGNWYILRSSDQQFEMANWGLSLSPFNDVPVAGDYDGDGKTDVGVFRRANGVWYVRQSGNGNFLIKQWGVGTDVPVVQDYDGDAKVDLAVWRGATGLWYVQESATGATRATAWGAGFAPYNDQAVPGDYDGDGQADLAVWRTGDATWYLSLSGVSQNSATRVVKLGAAGDRPVSARQP